MNKEAIWSNFTAWISNKGNDYAYRGVANKSWLLMPSIGRDGYEIDREIGLFMHFKLQAIQYKNQAANDFEWLAIAQHHGLPTRLLDWSLNPLVAAFFACKDEKGSGLVYATNNLHFIDTTTIDSPFSVTELGFIHPPISTPRLALQQGIFSIHPRPDCPIMLKLSNNNTLSVIDYMDRYMDASYPNLEDCKQFYGSRNFKAKKAICFEIPRSCKEYFLDKLHSMGIDDRIFGDLDAVARYLKLQNKTLPKIVNLKPEMHIPHVMNCVEKYIFNHLQNFQFDFDTFPYKITDQIIKLSNIDCKIGGSKIDYTYDMTLGAWLEGLKPYFSSFKDSDCFIENMLKIYSSKEKEWSDYLKTIQLCLFKVRVNYSHYNKHFEINLSDVSILDSEGSNRSKWYIIFFREKESSLRLNKYWKKMSKQKLTEEEILSVKTDLGLPTDGWLPQRY